MQNYYIRVLALEVRYLNDSTAASPGDTETHKVIEPECEGEITSGSLMVETHDFSPLIPGRNGDKEGSWLHRATSTK